MNTELLEKAIEILERPLPKKVTFDMGTYYRIYTDKLGQDCGTKGCIAFLLGTDHTFTDLGYSCVKRGPRLKGTTDKGRKVLCKLFSLEQDEVRYIFYSDFGESHLLNVSPIEAAINRIKRVIAGTTPTPAEVDDYEV